MFPTNLPAPYKFAPARYFPPFPEARLGLQLTATEGGEPVTSTATGDANRITVFLQITDGAGWADGGGFRGLSWPAQIAIGTGAGIVTGGIAFAIWAAADPKSIKNTFNPGHDGSPDPDPHTTPAPLASEPVAGDSDFTAPVSSPALADNPASLFWALTLPGDFGADFAEVTRDLPAIQGILQQWIDRGAPDATVQQQSGDSIHGQIHDIALIGTPAIEAAL